MEEDFDLLAVWIGSGRSDAKWKADSKLPTFFSLLLLFNLTNALCPLLLSVVVVLGLVFFVLADNSAAFITFSVI